MKVVFIVWIVFIHLEHKANLNQIRKCENKDLSGVVIPFKENVILELNQYLQSAEVSSIIYADLEPLIKKVDGCENNPEKPSPTEVAGHIPSGYSLSSIWIFDGVENKHNVY